MKWISCLAFFAFSLAARAEYCRCEIYALPPMSASDKTQTWTVAETRGKFYGRYDVAATRECRSDCASMAQTEYDEETLKEKLLPWVDELVAAGLNGYNCTGATTFKIPIRVRANLGPVRLGVSRESMIFIHRDRSCFI